MSIDIRASRDALASSAMSKYLSTIGSG
jgi:hypothetical protein